jgi:hypothetical protein
MSAVNEMTVTVDELDDFTIELCGGVSAKFADQGIACFPLDERHDAVTVAETPHDGVDLPRSEARTVFSAGRTL